MTPEELAFQFARRNPRLIYPRYAEGQCFEYSSRIQMFAHSKDMDAVLLVADDHSCNHFACEVEGVVIDLTARQFQDDIDFPLVCTREEWTVLAHTWLPNSEYYFSVEVADY